MVENSKDARRPVAYGYARVSTEQQAQSGLGLDAQEEQIRRYYEYALQPKDYLWGGMYVDPGVSGSIELNRRPSAGNMIAGLLDGDAVVFAKLDRGFRDVVDLLTTLEGWEKRKISSHFLDLHVDTSTDIGKLVITIMGAVARWERARIGQRIREAFARLRARGLYPGPAPYGFKKVGKLSVKPDPKQRSVGQWLLRAHLAHPRWSTQRLAEYAEEEGVRHWRGKIMYADMVGRIIRWELRLLNKESRGIDPLKRG